MPEDINETAKPERGRARVTIEIPGWLPVVVPVTLEYSKDSISEKRNARQAAIELVEHVLRRLNRPGDWRPWMRRKPAQGEIWPPR